MLTHHEVTLIALITLSIPTASFAEAKSPRFEDYPVTSQSECRDVVVNIRVSKFVLPHGRLELAGILVSNK